MNSPFLSAGIDPLAHLQRHTAMVPSAPFQGAWATIELQPDPFARQRYTVGVVVADVAGQFSFRLLDDLARFECFYGRDDLASFRLLMQSAEQALLRARRDDLPVGALQFEADALSVGELWPTAGASADAVLNRLYTDVVPFLPKDERKVRDFVTLDNAAVRKLVDDELKQIAGLAFERIAVEPQRAVLDHDTGESHWLEFNLEPPGKAGSVISAVYKTPDRIELNFLRASRDLATYARLKPTKRELGLFVMMPARDAMPAAELDLIDNVTGEQSWSLEKQGFVVSAHDSALPLAQDVWAWAAFDA